MNKDGEPIPQDDLSIPGQVASDQTLDQDDQTSPTGNETVDAKETRVQSEVRRIMGLLEETKRQVMARAEQRIADETEENGAVNEHMLWNTHLDVRLCDELERLEKEGVPQETTRMIEEGVLAELQISTEAYEEAKRRMDDYASIHAPGSEEETRVTVVLFRNNVGKRPDIIINVKPGEKFYKIASNNQ